MKSKADLAKVKHLKFVFVGQSDAGKTSLFNRMSENKFFPQNNFVGVDFKFSNMTFLKTQVRVEYWDTIGQQKYFSLQPNYYRKANVIFVCYDVSSPDSAQKLQRWLHAAEKSMEESSYICIVGCKKDLAVEANQEKIQGMAKKYQYCHFKTSSLTGEGVNELHVMSLESCIMNSPSFKQLTTPALSSIPISPNTTVTSSNSSMSKASRQAPKPLPRHLTSISHSTISSKQTSQSSLQPSQQDQENETVQTSKSAISQASSQAQSELEVRKGKNRR